MIACEFFTRFHHYVQYGLFFPVYKQTIHYSKGSIELAQTPKQKFIKPDNFDLVLSGGSVACSYGTLDPKNTLDVLLNKDSFNLCQEGFTLEDEINSITNLDPHNKTILFITGFNDAFLTKNIKIRQSKRNQILDKLYIISHSLFVVKVVYKLTHGYKNTFDEKDYSKQVKRLKSLAINNRLLVLHQPYLSPQKIKSLEEVEIFNQQNKHLNEIDFKNSRDFINKELSHLNAIDLQEHFDNDDRHLFTDLCHLTHLGNQKLGGIIRDLINSK
ncbi:MAG: hypothetical protein KC646_04975 [Candidatus Cloacimonetes bacterium]|nr:hypothetical protein [Candidatus Cloacimonadota bacterium]